MKVQITDLLSITFFNFLSVTLVVCLFVTEGMVAPHRTALLLEALPNSVKRPFLTRLPIRFLPEVYLVQAGIEPTTLLGLLHLTEFLEDYGLHAYLQAPKWPIHATWSCCCRFAMQSHPQPSTDSSHPQMPEGQ